MYICGSNDLKMVVGDATKAKSTKSKQRGSELSKLLVSFVAAAPLSLYRWVSFFFGTYNFLQHCRALC